MGNVSSLSSLSSSFSSNNISYIKNFNFEEMLIEINNNSNIIINTMDENNQECLIPNTIAPYQEVKLLNECLNDNKNQKIIIYGTNNNDEKIFIKYQQLIGLGFTNVSIYIGGMFEWLLLQEIYGIDKFPTTTSELDILKYK